MRSGLEPGAAGLLDAVLTDAAVDRALDDDAVLAGMLRFESVLASASERAGLIPPEDAAAIRAACVTSPVDPAALAERTGLSGSPVVPLIQELCQTVGESAARSVHFGATTQDTLDTAMALVARAVVALIRGALVSAAGHCARLGEAERDTIVVGRTLGQHAQPTTFGLKASGWCLALWEAHDDLERAGRQLAVQLGGAAGTLGAFGDHGLEILRYMAETLGLRAPVLPWHSDRTRVARLAGALAEVCGVWSKIAVDVALLSQTEVAEVSERVPGGGRSSAMPHKRNPAGAIAVRAGAVRAPALASALFSTMGQENERGIGTWQAEWVPLRELLRLTGALTTRGERLLKSLSLDRDQMSRNLRLSRGLEMSERLMNLLAPRLGRLKAQAVVAELCDRVRAGAGSLAEVAAGDHRVREVCPPDELEYLLDPRLAVRAAGTLIDSALTAHRAHLDRVGADQE